MKNYEEMKRNVKKRKEMKNYELLRRCMKEYEDL